MITRSKTKPSAILKEGTYEATVNSVKGLPSEADAKKARMGYKVKGYDAELTKDYPNALDASTPLRADVETLLKREFTASEAETGVDLQTLVGQPCRIVVFHKSGAGGKPAAAVSLVLPAA